MENRRHKKIRGAVQTSNDLFNRNNKDFQRERTEKMVRRKSPINSRGFPRIEGHDPHQVTSPRNLTTFMRKRQFCKEKGRKGRREREK